MVHIKETVKKNTNAYENLFSEMNMNVMMTPVLPGEPHRFGATHEER